MSPAFKMALKSTVANMDEDLFMRANAYTKDRAVDLFVSAGVVPDVAAILAVWLSLGAIAVADGMLGES